MYKILVRFRDKHTNKIYNVGDVVKFTKKRVKEILEVGPFIEEIKEEKPTE